MKKRKRGIYVLPIQKIFALGTVVLALTAFLVSP